MESLSTSSSQHACEQALALLRDVTRTFDATKRPNMMPNVRIFSMAILTLSRNQGSVVEARNLLTELVNLYEETGHEDLRPNAYPYNYVIDCAANSKSKSQDDKTRYFLIATKTYREMHNSNYVEPDSFTYLFWLKCCNNLLDDTSLRAKCVRYAFDQCKEKGLVTNDFLKRLYQGSPLSLVNELLDVECSGQEGPHERTSFRIADLPLAWSRNALRKWKWQNS